MRAIIGFLLCLLFFFVGLAYSPPTRAADKQDFGVVFTAQTPQEQVQFTPIKVVIYFGEISTEKPKDTQYEVDKRGLLYNYLSYNSQKIYNYKGTNPKNPFFKVDEQVFSV